MITEYLRWMAENTKSQWNNDSADYNDIDDALQSGAVGATSNPPLSYAVLTQYPEIYKEEIQNLDASLTGDDRAVALIGIVVKRIAARLRPLYQASNCKYGYIRAQVKPMDFKDKEAMLKVGLQFASWAENIKVKIPGSKAGVWVLEELAALGIPTNPTVCVSIPQILAVAEANERGRKRAIESGLNPAESSAAFVMGRLQDYLSHLNERNQVGLSVSDLENAMIAITKKLYFIMKERGYSQVLMPAAFRCARQVTELSGAEVEMTIHPKIQEMINAADAKGDLKRIESLNNPVDEEALSRVLQAFPDFRKAYDEDGLSIDEFDEFGATVMTLNGFDQGWQKLLEL
jgi:transaldolase